MTIYSPKTIFWQLWSRTSWLRPVISFTSTISNRSEKVILCMAPTEALAFNCSKFRSFVSSSDKMAVTSWSRSSYIFIRNNPSKRYWYTGESLLFSTGAALRHNFDDNETTLLHAWAETNTFKPAKSEDIFARGSGWALQVDWKTMHT